MFNGELGLHESLSGPVMLQCEVHASTYNTDKHSLIRLTSLVSFDT